MLPFAEHIRLRSSSEHIFRVHVLFGCSVNFLVLLTELLRGMPVLFSHGPDGLLRGMTEGQWWVQAELAALLYSGVGVPASCGLPPWRCSRQALIFLLGLMVRI